MAILALWGSSAQGQVPFLSSLPSNVVEDSASLASTTPYETSDREMAELNSAFSGSGGGISDDTSSPSQQSTPVINSGALAAITPPDSSFLDGFKASQVVNYVVKDGDTIGLIAGDYGVSIDTIVWANNIKDPNSLSVGQNLKIPPVTGIIYTVMPGDTVTSIAKKYNADPAKILSFNNLQEGQMLIAETDLMVPGGELPGPKPSVKPAAAKGSGGFGNYKPVGNGQCVDFVQAHGYPNLKGNANQWSRYINTLVPVPGGVVVFRGGRYGHVAIITAVEPSSIQIVEQNYYGLFIIDHREVSMNDRSIVGFIR
ncbi:MAG TPA: LysM peptidoglycan-binding domain-containing protein [Candidatus Paceibacterota bacterium]|nr:LysM peptidoglycan-binding domain-containing protein [Candidatus Paceibacterota bacterium]